MSNCGLPDGVVHQHAERCYQAGLQDGAVMFREENREAIEALMDFAALAVPALLAVEESAPIREVLDEEQFHRLAIYLLEYKVGL